MHLHEFHLASLTFYHLEVDSCLHQQRQIGRLVRLEEKKERRKEGKKERRKEGKKENIELERSLL